MTTKSKEIAKIVFEALVSECSNSKYKSTTEFKWLVSAGALSIERGLWVSQEKFNDAYHSLMKAGFVERHNVKHNTKYGRGFFTFKPTKKGLDRLNQLTT